MVIEDFFTNETLGLNDKTWELIFKDFNILEAVKQGIYDIDAETIKKYRREPRLMAKYDSKDELPVVMRKNKLSILPYKNRGHYAIGYFDVFTKVKNDPLLRGRKVINDLNLDTLDPFKIHKEPSMILAAYNYNIINNITESDYLITNFGRESTVEFDYMINNLKGGRYDIHVGKSQIEIDGVFESDDSVIIVEGKMGDKTEFVTRQLYYPYRLLKQQTDKDIYVVFMNYSSGSIFAHTYQFTDMNNYNSLKMIKTERYDFYEDLSVSDISSIIIDAKIESEPDIPFPQADSMFRVFDALELIYLKNGINNGVIGEEMSLTGRQGHYYGQACQYLGLVAKGNGYQITQIGKEILIRNQGTKNQLMIKQMAKHKIFNYFMKEYLEQSRPPTISEIIEFMKNDPELSKRMPGDTTKKRRAQTVLSWINWAFSIAAADN